MLLLPELVSEEDTMKAQNLVLKSNTCLSQYSLQCLDVPQFPL